MIIAPINGSFAQFSVSKTNNNFLKRTKIDIYYFMIVIPNFPPKSFNF